MTIAGCVAYNHNACVCASGPCGTNRISKENIIDIKAPPFTMATKSFLYILSCGNFFIV